MVDTWFQGHQASMDKRFKDGTLGRRRGKGHHPKNNLNNLSIAQLQTMLADLVKNRPGFDDILARTKYAQEKDKLETLIACLSRGENVKA